MRSLGSALIERLVGTATGGSPLEVLLGEHEALDDALATQPDALLAAVEANAANARGVPATLVASSFASAACEANGRLVAADARFLDWLDGPDPLDQVVRAVGDARPRLTAIVDDRTGRPVAVAAGCYSLATGWPLSDEVRLSLACGRASHAVIAFRPDDDAWGRARRAFGLTPSEVALARALGRTGHLKAACADTGIAYETGRKLVASAMRKVGAERQSDLVRTLLAIVAGDVASPAHVERVLSDIFSLTPRQAKLALAIAGGATRDGAAAQAEVSPHVVKDALRVVFDACGVANATDLARLVAEVEALAGLATACDVDVNAGLAAEPLRLVNRSWAPGRIAVSDHGPVDGHPVIVAHAMMNGRHLPRALIAAMQARGQRPISFDRAGYGLSDWLGGDVVETAVADLRDVLDALELKRAHILARGGIAAMLTAALRMPDRIAGGVLAGPETPVSLDSNRGGILGLGKRLIYDNPRFTEPLVRLLGGRNSAATTLRLHQESVCGSPADEAIAGDPGLVGEMVRATRQASTGIKGFLHEVAAHGRGLEPPSLPSGTAWSVIGGATDQIYDQAKAATYWANLLPGAQVDLIADAGRWLHATHPQILAAALQRLIVADRKT